uniref:Nuclear receptor domain-containing protein n=1 Tax=Caenorhabditis tropicalis TaxID=1561998 RepID=A0A1I7TP32_9PELO
MCKACRFSKCVEVGMDPTAIRAAVKTAEGKFLLNGVSRKQKIRSGEMRSNNDFLSNMIKNLSYLEEKAEGLHFSAIPIGYEDLRTLSEILQIGPEFDSYRIQNLTPILDQKPRVICMTYMHSGLLASVESSKTFEFYSKLSDEGKTILIKHVSLIGSIMMSASFSMHLRKSDVLLMPDGSVYGNKVGCMGDELLEQYKKELQKTLIAFMRNNVDRVEYMLLKAILMRNPSVAGLSSEDREIIENERNLYGRALLEYNILQYGILSGPGRFGELIAINSIIETQSKKQKDVYLWIKASSDKSNCSHPPKYLFDEIMDS